MHGFGVATDNRSNPAGEPRVLGTWLAAGMSLAAVGLMAQTGPAIVVGALLLAPLPFVFSRLQQNAPGARTTSDLVGAVLGERVGVFTAVVQLIAYLFIALTFSRAYATGILIPILGPEAPLENNWSLFVSVPVLVIAGVLAALPMLRGIAWCVTIPAAIGAAIYFYISLALIAMEFVGRAPDLNVPGSPAPAVDPSLGGLLLGVILLAGLEVVTTANRETRSVGRSMACALALIGVVAVTITAAVMISPVQSTALSLSAIAYLGGAGAVWIYLGGIAFAWAGLLVFMFGMHRISGRLSDQLRIPMPIFWGAEALVVVGALIVSLASPADADWAGALTSGFADVGRILVLVVYAVAAQACARVGNAGSAGVAQAVRLYMWALIVGVLGTTLYLFETDGFSPGPLIAAALLAAAAAGLAFKTGRLSTNTGRATHSEVEFP